MTCLFDDERIVYWLGQLVSKPTIWVGDCPQEEGEGECGAAGAIFTMSHPGQQVRVLCTVCRRRSVIQDDLLYWEWEDL